MIVSLVVHDFVGDFSLHVTEKRVHIILGVSLVSGLTDVFGGVVSCIESDGMHIKIVCLRNER
jgi:hypothetical protein